MAVRGVRGAITITSDQAEQVLSATQELLEAIQAANPTLRSADLASIWFTATPDICSVHPARAARNLGWTQVPLMCSVEMDVPAGLPHCIRVLLHWNTDLPQSAIQHVYLKEAVRLRPDLVNTTPNQSELIS